MNTEELGKHLEESIKYQNRENDNLKSIQMSEEAERKGWWLPILPSIISIIISLILIMKKLSIL